MNQVFHRLFIAHLLIALSSCVALSQASNKPIAEVPFAFDHTSVVIEVKVNGKGPFNMVLDTGSDVATIDLATGNVTTVGQTMNNLDALAVQPAVPDSMSTLWLAIPLGVILFSTGQRRRANLG